MNTRDARRSQISNLATWRLRSRLRLILLVGLTVGTTACDDESSSSNPSSETKSQTTAHSEQAPDETPRIRYPSGEKPAADTEIARSGPLSVTFADYKEFLERSRLFAPSQRPDTRPNSESLGSDDEPTAHRTKTQQKGERPDDDAFARKRANPRLQVRTIRTLLRHKVLQHLAELNEVTVSEATIREKLTSDPKLSQYVTYEHASTDASADDPKLTLTGELPGGNDLEDLRTIARIELTRDALRDQLLEQTTQKDLWEWYQSRHNRAAVMYVQRLNVPESSRIDAFVKSSADAIHEHYKNNKGQYRAPRLVEITELVPRTADNDTEALRKRLKKAAEQLEAGTPPKRVADTFDLKVQGTKQINQRANRKAYKMSPGEAGFRLRGRQAPHVWRVENVQAAQPQALDSSLKRQIASELLQQRGVVPSVRNHLEGALAIMRRAESTSKGTLTDDVADTLEKQLDRDGYTPKTTELFTNNERGYVPGIGLAKSVMSLAFSLDGEQPVASEPVADRQHAYAVRLLDHETPSRATFEANLESVRTDYRTSVDRFIVDDAIDAWYKEHPPDMNLTPIRVEYGVLRKK